MKSSKPSYSSKSKICSNPYNLPHTKKYYSSVRPVSASYIQAHRSLQGVVSAGDRLCDKCRKQIPRRDTEARNKPGPSGQPAVIGKLRLRDTEEASSSTPTTVPSSPETGATPVKQIATEELNKIMEVVGETPVRTGGLKEHQRKRKYQKKLSSVKAGVAKRLSASYAVEIDSDIDSPEGDKALPNIELYERMMNELVDKFNHPSTAYATKLQILTLSPFTIEKTAARFGATIHMVKRSRSLKAAEGVLAMPGPKKPSVTVSDATKRAVQQFYERDDISRICPGQKDTVSVRDPDGEKRHHQKRLVLSNLREIYQQYKSETSQPVGFSVFASLRPPWCVLAGASGTHSVCVCIHHQNPKLMLKSVRPNLTVNDLMEKTVCDIQRELCMLGKCEECPGDENLRTFLQEEEGLNDAEEIEFRQWMSTDRTTLVSVRQAKDEFIDTLVSSILRLRSHHFIAHEQNKYLKELKASLSTQEAIVMGDFAENYAFVVQDAIQGYYWQNTQATVHPFAVYTKSGNQLKCDSYCVISDSLKHSTSAVFAFQCEVLECVKSQHPDVRKVHYFTDGAVSQYKNKFNIRNMTVHKEDFGLECEWHFFATCHGKGPCDGIGGTAKRMTARVSLQRPQTDQICTPHAMFQFCKSSVLGIHFIYVTESDIAKKDSKLKSRFANARPIKGTRGFHCFRPIDSTTVDAYETSTSISSRRFQTA